MSSFIAASLLILVLPGPTNALLAACGAVMARRQALVIVLAPCLGYLLAVPLYVASADHLAAIPGALAAVKLVAAAWLAFSALRLWNLPHAAAATSLRASFLRVLTTTLLNPKAMVFGTLLVPRDSPGLAAAAIMLLVLFAALSGALWMLFGTLLPSRARRHSNRGAAVVLIGFAVTAISSAVG